MAERIGDSTSRRLLPPIPSEHGAWVMLAAALSTPVAVAVARGTASTTGPLRFGLFAVLSVLALLFREALRRLDRHEEPDLRRRLRRILAVEAAAIVLVAATLAALAGPWWALSVLAVPAVVADVRVRRRGWPVPLGGELSGVAALSVAVPAGTLALEIGGADAALLLWLLFLGFHVGSVLRVQSRLGGRDSRAPMIRRVARAYHVLALASAVVAWYVGALGPGAPLVFVVAAARTGIGGEAPAEPRALGRTEGALSTLFVLSAPWLLVF